MKKITGGLITAAVAAVISLAVVSPASAATGPTPTPSPTPTAPSCVNTAVYSYVYDASTNSGSVTMSGDDCGNHLFVTATSWTYTQDAVWPQNRDLVDQVTIPGPGTYQFRATVTCGQGDIYAQFGQPTEPTTTLTGPSGGFAEHFLSDVPGITGGTAPTYIQQSPSCYTPPVASATVTITPATCTTGAMASVGTVTNATLTSSPATFTGPGNYSFTFGRTGNALFSASASGVSQDRTTETYSGTLPGKDTSKCSSVPTPPATPPTVPAAGTDGGELVHAAAHSSTVAASTLASTKNSYLVDGGAAVLLLALIIGGILFVNRRRRSSSVG